MSDGRRCPLDLRPLCRTVENEPGGEGAEYHRRPSAGSERREKKGERKSDDAERSRCADRPQLVEERLGQKIPTDNGNHYESDGESRRDRDPRQRPRSAKYHAGDDRENDQADDVVENRSSEHDLPFPRIELSQIRQDTG